MQSEEWRIIPGFEDYEASSQGRIRRIEATCRGPAGNILKPTLRDDGYLRIGLRVKGKTKQKDVHQLVMLAFQGPPPPGMEVLHSTPNRVDCRLSNLSYGTHAQNGLDMVRHGTVAVHKGEAHGMARLTDDDVRTIRTSKETLKVLMERYGIKSMSYMSNLKNGKFRPL